MIIMDGIESPLDVLSRAAIMLQENRNEEIGSEDTKQLAKQLPTTKWKKERRVRSEYARKSDPKLPEDFHFSPPENAGDIPLDMSVRQRGDPPSYDQSIGNKRLNYRSQFSVQNKDVPNGISMCDPIIDEHFRRSLGKDYGKVFNNNVPQVKEAAPAMKTVVLMEMMDGNGLSVDEHFAKALGDTWLKLNKRGGEINGETADATLMSV